MQLRLPAAIGLSIASIAYGRNTALEFRGSLSWLNGIKAEETAPSDLNKENQLKIVRDRQALSELRPNLKLSTSEIQFVARPRIQYETCRVTSQGKSGSPETEVQSVMREAFLQWTLSEQVTFSYGLQSYQWGGSESLSPSNRLFHETAVQRTAFFEATGKNIARVNFSLGKSFSTVVLADVEENKDETSWQYGDTWHATGLIKPEFNWNNGADYFGLVFGGRAEGKPWVGEYFSYGLPFIDGITLFADAAHEKGSRAWRPISGSDGRTLDFSKTLADDKKVQTIAAGGAKYDFVGGSILRVEYILNQPGYSKNELEKAKAGLLSPAPLDRQAFQENLSRFLAPGLELMGQRFWYASLHIPDFLTVTDLTYTMRLLSSATDMSKSFYTNFDYKIGDAGTLSLALTNTTGDQGSELRGFVGKSQMVTYRYDW